MIVEIGNVLVSTDIITEKFCCDLSKCKGACCIEGDAGAPVAFDEIADLEKSADTVWSGLSASAQSVIERQGVVYNDRDGDLVTSIVNGKDCVFTCYKDIELDGETASDCCLCALESAFREGKSRFCKPMSCSLYPIREKKMANGYIGLTYHQWHICQDARAKGKALDMPVYKFLRAPLTRRFGKEWYEELELVAQQLAVQGLV
jgi:hypothetical protein